MGREPKGFIERVSRHLAFVRRVGNPIFGLIREKVVKMVGLSGQVR